MVVTCENCSARYKLDDNRISGRGAKITCPRCRHVFVVYKDRAAAEAQGRIAVGGGVLGPPSTSSADLSASPDPVTAEVTENVEDAVDSLDFRTVGIQAWKVKVKIGLVYDFSDYRTLARYIAEGRVTASDKLSHNGTDWTEISEIPDLAAHFVAVYKQLEAELAAEDVGEEEDYEDDEPTNIMGRAGGAFAESAAKAVSLTSFSSSAAPRILPSDADGGSDIQSAMSAALDAEQSPKPPAPTGPRFIDPFEKRKAQGRRPSGPSSAGGSGNKAKTRPRPSSGGGTRSTNAQGGSNGWMVGVLVLGLLGIGGWYYTQSMSEATAPVATAAPAAPTVKPASREEIVAAITKDLQATEPEEPEDGPEDSMEEDAWGGEEPKLIPVGPRGTSRSAVTGKAATPSKAPVSRSAREHAAEGDSAMQRRDYQSAAAAFRKAVSMEPSNSYYSGRLGNALFRSGNPDAAMGPLNTAAGAGYERAFVDLGDIAAQRGDAAGAIGYYQSYLATNPRDAQTVQAKIDRLSGS